MQVTKSNGIDLHYREDGRADAPALVLINPLATDLRVWDRVVERLGTNYRIIRFDKRGHGLSEAPQPPYALADQVADVLGLMDALGVETASICGMSVGGLIAQAVYAAAPERVRSLVLCNTLGAFGTPDVWDGMIEGARADGLDGLAEMFMERWFPQSFRRSEPEEVTGWRTMCARTPLDGFIGTLTTLRDGNVTDNLPNIAVPTAVIAGDEDGATPADAVEEFAGRIPGAKYHLIKGTGHLPNVVEPGEVAAVIKSVA